MAGVLRPFTETLVLVISANDPLTIADRLLSKGLLTTDVYAGLLNANYSKKMIAREIFVNFLLN